MTRIDRSYDSRVAAALAENYGELRRRCRRNFRRGEAEFEDVMQETLLFVMCDARAAALAGTPELLDYCVYKFRMMAFQTVKRNRRMASYADSLRNARTEYGL